MRRGLAVFFATLVRLVTAFHDGEQGQRGKNNEGNDDLPHDSFSNEKKKGPPKEGLD